MSSGARAVPEAGKGRGVAAAVGGGTAGFTLVELLVASAILGLVALLIVNGMRFVRKAVASADQRREAVEGTLTGVGLARGTLGRALPVFRKVESQDRLLFEGGEDRLRFVTVESDYLPGWPLVAYEYAVALRDGRYLLEVRRAAVDPGAPGLDALEDARPRALLGFSGPVRFAYFGRLKPRDQPSTAVWRGEWQAEAELLPEAVRIGPEGGGEPAWPDFVVPLRVNTPAGCVSAGGGAGGGAAGGTADAGSASSGAASGSSRVGSGTGSSITSETGSSRTGSQTKGCSR